MTNEENESWDKQVCYPSEEGISLIYLDDTRSYDAASPSVAQNSDEAYVLKQIHETFS